MPFQRQEKGRTRGGEPFIHHDPVEPCYRPLGEQQVIDQFFFLLVGRFDTGQIVGECVAGPLQILHLVQGVVRHHPGGRIIVVNYPFDRVGLPLREVEALAVLRTEG